MTTMENLPEVVSREQWLVTRKQLLLKEKELTRSRAHLNAESMMFSFAVEEVGQETS